MAKIGEDVLRAALERCARESEHAELNQDRYHRWRSSLDDSRAVPGPLAFGNAKAFQQFCEANDVACLVARSKAPVRSIAFMSERQLRRVIDRFLAESHCYRIADYELWRAAGLQAGEVLPSAKTLKNALGPWSKLVDPPGDEPVEAVSAT